MLRGDSNPHLPCMQDVDVYTALATVKWRVSIHVPIAGGIYAHTLAPYSHKRAAI